MDTHEQRFAAYDVQVREKYTDDDRKTMAKSGEAMPDGSYPIRDQEDLENAIHAVGRGNTSHDAIRKHIIARANALGLAKLVPDNWSADGSLKQANMARTPLARRRKPRHRSVPLMPEVRHWSIQGRLEVRDGDREGNIVEVVGEPIVYHEPYAVRDAFGEFQETMHPGVAADALGRGADVRFLLNHDGLPMARTLSGTLTFEDTPTALRSIARLDIRQQLANDFLIAVERGDLNQMSVGFVTGLDEWNESMDERSIYRFAEFLDVSGVTYPASPTTSLKIAQRMALEIPVESRARARKLYADLRAGKVLSQGNQDKLVAAATALHQILDNAGFDPQDLLGSEDFREDETHEPTVDAGIDGSGDDGGSDEEDNGASGVFADGSGTRSDVDPGEPMRAVKLARLRVQMEARKRRRIAA